MMKAEREAIREIETAQFWYLTELMSLKPSEQGGHFTLYGPGGSVAYEGTQTKVLAKMKREYGQLLVERELAQRVKLRRRKA